MRKAPEANHRTAELSKKNLYFFILCKKDRAIRSFLLYLMITVLPVGGTGCFMLWTAFSFLFRAPVFLCMLCHLEASLRVD